MTKEDSISVTVAYPAGHSIRSEWVPSKVYCPNCGKQKVYAETSGGDYYVGEDYVCVACESRFNLPDLCPIDEFHDTYRQVVDQLPK